MADSKETMSVENTRIDYTEVIRDLDGFDDVFFNALLQGNPEGTQQLLRTVLRKPDLVIRRYPGTQQFLKNIYGKSIRMDDYAESTDKVFNTEVQRRSAGANPHRARLNSSLLDANVSDPGEEAENLPDTYVIFITEYDVYGAGEPFYEIERVVKTTGVDFNDGSHILYVNGAYQGDDPIGWLMHDLHCTNPHDMHDGPLKERALYLKENKEGVRTMSDKMNEMMKDITGQYYQAGANSAQKNNAKEMLMDGSLPVQKIARFSGLSVREVEQMKKNLGK